APLPEFKTPKQLAEWRAELAAKSAASTKSPTQDTAFYTGKPYLASTGSYAFKYRAYNPELARWTSEDPSGFPDGANGSVYISNMAPNSYDSDGLQRREIDEKSITPTGGTWQTAGYEYVTNIYRTAYEIKYTYTNPYETNIGQTTGFGHELNGSSTVGFSQTKQANISATGWSVTLGISISQTGSYSSTINFQRASEDKVAWEGYVLAYEANIYYHVRGEWQNSEGKWVADTSNNGGNWSASAFLDSGYTSVYGKIIYKVYE
ncbi:MAG: RHS repeat-associated core domain-containing protein, partial [Luteolibacter sp.]